MAHPRAGAPAPTVWQDADSQGRGRNTKRHSEKLSDGRDIPRMPEASRGWGEGGTRAARDHGSPGVFAVPGHKKLNRILPDLYIASAEREQGGLVYASIRHG